ncbi:MAG: 30S ribosomal protein S19e [Candidatus Altiarchaeales archaeon]|nr:30S ribosomal protein S19e [Candidatus Altiarchaeales archaeon]
MTTVYDVSAQDLINKLAENLKKEGEIKTPGFAVGIKTGSSKQKQPQDPDWWFFRCASILRKVYCMGPVGTENLRKEYSSKLRRGRKPATSRKAGGKIIRTILKDLDEKGYTEKTRKGRILTARGKSYLDKIATDLAKQ